MLDPVPATGVPGLYRRVAAVIPNVLHELGAVCRVSSKSWWLMSQPLGWRRSRWQLSQPSRLIRAGA